MRMLQASGTRCELVRRPWAVVSINGELDTWGETGEEMEVEGGGQFVVGVRHERDEHTHEPLPRSPSSNANRWICGTDQGRW